MSNPPNLDIITTDEVDDLTQRVQRTEIREWSRYRNMIQITALNGAVQTYAQAVSPKRKRTKRGRRR